MISSEFNIIKQHIGIKLLNYLLNEKEKITNVLSFEKIDFTDNQIKVLEDLYERIQHLKILLIKDNRLSVNEDLASNFPNYLIENQNPFNFYRKKCGGKFPSIPKNDKILEFLLNICIREYPNFLLNPSNVTFKKDHNIYLGKKDIIEFNLLISKDVLYEITNKEENNMSNIYFLKLENNQAYSGWAHQLCSTIIERSFYNSCYKMKYDLIEVIKEVKINLEKVRKLIKNEEIEYSTYVGVKGLEFVGFKELNIENITIRQIKDFSTPSPHFPKIILGKNHGCIVEIKHTTKKIKDDLTNNIDINNENENIIERLRLSFIFSSLEDKSISTTFYEDGFPLHKTGNSYGIEDKPLRKVQINKKQKKQILFWYDHLNLVDLSNVQVPIKRLKMAILERNNPEDSILDAMIAWEGMFSDSFETVFKVTGSIFKFISPHNSNISYDRLKTLYDIRSELVHGKYGKKLKKENLQALRSEVIQIGLECLSHLLQNEKLLKLEPSERVKKIMLDL